MIPKIIHQIGPSNMDDWHPMWKLCYPSWKKNFPDTEYKHILWNDNTDLDEFVKNKFEGIYFDFYNSLPFHLCKLDFARLLLLYEFGGIYADLDMYCYKNFYNFIKKDVALCQDGDFLFADHTIAMNNLIISDKNNKFILAYINGIMNHYYEYHEHITKQMYCFDLTIFQLSRSYMRYENKQDIQILPYELFAPQPLSYDENMFTKHMHTYIHGKEEIEKLKNIDTHISLEEKYKKIYKERPINIAIDDWDFYKTYTRYR